MKILTQSSGPVLGSVVVAGLTVALGTGDTLNRDAGAIVGVAAGDAVGVAVLKVGFPALYKLHEFPFSFTRTAQEKF